MLEAILPSLPRRNTSEWPFEFQKNRMTAAVQAYAHALEHVTVVFPNWLLTEDSWMPISSPISLRAVWMMCWSCPMSTCPRRHETKRCKTKRYIHSVRHQHVHSGQDLMENAVCIVRRYACRRQGRDGCLELHGAGGRHGDKEASFCSKGLQQQHTTPIHNFKLHPPIQPNSALCRPTRHGPNHITNTTGACQNRKRGWFRFAAPGASECRKRVCHACVTQRGSWAHKRTQTQRRISPGEACALFLSSAYPQARSSTHPPPPQPPPGGRQSKTR